MNGITDFNRYTYSADAFLHIREAFSQRMRRSEQKRNQRMHSGRGEENGGVVIGNQRRAFDDGVPFAFEEFQELGS